jgi:hypothetical protein
MTVLNRQGFLYVAGGEEIEGRAAKQSDVWRSTISLTQSKATLTVACPGIRFPTQCAVATGLQCWPGSTVTLAPGAAASCATLRACKLYPDEESSSSSSGGLPAPPQSSSSSASLSPELVILIVGLVLLSVAALGYLLYRRKLQQPQYSRDEGLLSTEGASSLPPNTSYAELQADTQHADTQSTEADGVRS